MNQGDYQLVIEICLAVVLLLAPFAGVLRAIRRLRAKAESAAAPICAGLVVAADAIAGLMGFFRSDIALAAVLLGVLWLIAAAAANALVRRARAKAERLARAAPAPAPRLPQQP